jgi:hypothetical protein
MILLRYYVHACLLFSLVYSLLTVRADSPVPFRLMKWWVILTVPTEIAAILLGYFYHLNHYIYNVWQPIESFLILLMFYKGTTQRVTHRLCGWLLVLLPAGILFIYLVHFVFITLNVPETVFCLFTQLIGACIFLTDSFLWSEELSIFRRPLSWMAMGTILYSCAFILMHGLWDYMLIWPLWRFRAWVSLANTFQYGGVVLSLYALRKSNHE